MGKLIINNVSQKQPFKRTALLICKYERRLDINRI